MSPHLALASLLLAFSGCNESVLHPEGNGEGLGPPRSISGRICDPSGRTWLEDAAVFTYLYDHDGVEYDVRTAYSDREGHWSLDDLPSRDTYQVYVTYGSDEIGNFEVFLPSGKDVELDDPECFDPLGFDVAVITGDYDEFELVLQDLGFDNYHVIDGRAAFALKEFLLDLASMQFYDIIFVNGGHIEEDVIYDVDGSLVPDKEGFTDVDRIRANLLAYTSGGGSIYVSDWAYDLVEQTWPDMLEFVGDDSVPDAAQTGESQVVNAAVADTALAEFLGTNYTSITYDLAVWPPIENVEPAVSVFLSGNVSYRVGGSTYNLPTSPLLVSFSPGDGRVVFSTFRLKRNATTEMMEILQYMLYNL